MLKVVFVSKAELSANVVTVMLSITKLNVELVSVVEISVIILTSVGLSVIIVRVMAPIEQ
jgi:hypothetical protein